MKFVLAVIVCFLSSPLTSNAATTGSPIADKPTVANPFSIKDKSRLRTTTGGTSTTAIDAANAALQSGGLNSRTSFSTTIGTTSGTGALGSIAATAGVTNAAIGQAKAGNTKPIEATTAQTANIATSNQQAGVAPITINIRYINTWNEVITPLKPGGPTPLLINTPYTIGSMSLNSAGVAGSKVKAQFSASGIKDVTLLSSVHLGLSLANPLPGIGKKGFIIRWPCAVDVATGTNTCCGLPAADSTFYMSKGVGGLGDNLDMIGPNDALVYTSSTKSLATQTQLDSIAHLMLCRFTTSMDHVIPGSAKFIAQGFL